jgi:hypothetical protein
MFAFTTFFSSCALACTSSMRISTPCDACAPTVLSTTRRDAVSSWVSTSVVAALLRCTRIDCQHADYITNMIAMAEQQRCPEFAPPCYQDALLAPSSDNKMNCSSCSVWSRLTSMLLQRPRNLWDWASLHCCLLSNMT